MDNEDLDALAAEYVLGTLASDERAHAEALLTIDRGFAEIVHQWERRLGELNVMVEAVEPPPELWDKIKSQLGDVAPNEDVRLVPSEWPATESKPGTNPKPDPTNKPSPGADASPLLAALAASLTSDDAEGKTGAVPDPRPEGRPRTPPTTPSETFERSDADGVDAPGVDVRRRVRRWRRIAFAAGLIALLLAAFIGVSQFAPGLIPSGVIQMPQLFATRPAPATPRAGALVAVLQHDPSAPAFLLTVDVAARLLTIRRVAVTPEAGHSYELWLFAPGAKPRSLGVIGEDQFTQRPLPANIDVDAMRAANYAVSFEPSGGSKAEGPSGPILFTGRLIESLPPAQGGR